MSKAKAPSSYKCLELKLEPPIARVTLKRPDVHNALNEELIAELTQVFDGLGNDAATRVILLSGAGKSFSAGADLHWMQGVIQFTFEENVRDAHALAAMYAAIDRCPKPVVARVQGAAIGGGAGLVAVADIAIAEEGAQFGFSEVRLGIVPAVISPYVLAKIGAGAARHYFLTGERFSAKRAVEIGLVSVAVAADQLDREVERITKELLQSAPGAVADAKGLISCISVETSRARATEFTVRLIAERRTSAEGQEGMRAFLEKRPPSWSPK